MSTPPVTSAIEPAMGDGTVVEQDREPTCATSAKSSPLRKHQRDIPQAEDEDHSGNKRARENDCHGPEPALDNNGPSIREDPASDSNAVGSNEGLVGNVSRSPDGHASRDGPASAESSLFVPQDERSDDAVQHPVEGSDSEDSDESDEDDDESGIIYDPSQEPLPAFPSYDRDFHQVVIDLEALGKKSMAILDESQCGSRRVEGCRANAIQVANAPKPRILEIGLFGDTGAGKSSLINAFLDLPGLAKAISGGTSCTHVVTKYRRAFDGQGKDFAVEVVYFDMRTIAKMLDENLENYNTYNFTKDQDWSEDIRQEYKRQSDSAVKLFRTLFCDQEAFKTAAAAKAYLEKNKKTPDAVARTMVGWARSNLEKLQAFGMEFRHYCEHDTIEQYSAAIEPLLFGTSHLDEPSLWPFVRIVSVGVRGPDVLDHVTIVDLPGLDDSNTLRVATTHAQIDACDVMWVVAHIDRAITNTTIDNLLARYAEAFKGNVAVILTRSDADITDGVIEHLKRERCDLSRYEKLLKEERFLRKMKKRRARQVAQRSQKMASKKKMREMTDAQRAKLAQQLEDYHEQLSVYKERLPTKTMERFAALVEVRNEYVTRQVQEERQSHMPAGTELPVFCVSNLFYQALRGGALIEGDLMTPVATGIPALRTHVYTTVAPLILQTVEDFIDHKCEVFMKGLGLWARSVVIESANTFMEIVRNPARQAKPKVEQYLEWALVESESCLVKPLTHKQQRFIDHALTVLEKKKSWHWGTLRAFVKKGGNHCTASMPKESWNEQFSETANKIIQIEWDEYVQKQIKEFSNMKDAIIELLNSVSEGIRKHPQAILLPIDRIESSLNSHIEGIIQAAKEHQRVHVKKGLRNFKLDATQDRPSGFFHLAMQPIYDECGALHGSGVKSSTLLKMEDFLKTPKKKNSPFSGMCKKMTQAISKDARAQAKIFQRTVDAVFADIEWQFNSMVDQDGDDYGEDALKEALRDFLEKGERDLEDIKMELKRIKRKYDVGSFDV